MAAKPNSLPVDDPVAELEKTWELCQRIVLSPDKAKLEDDLLVPAACLLGADAAVFRVFSSSSRFPTLLASLGIRDCVNDAYLSRYFRLDPVSNLLARRFGGPLFADRNSPGRWQDGCDQAGAHSGTGNTIASMIARYRENFHRYESEFLRPNNLHHHVGFCFQDEDSNYTFVVNFIRGKESSPFDRLEFARARIIGTLLHARAARFSCDTTGPHDYDAMACSSHLSPREYEVAKAVASGLTNKEVGETLNISVRTVENHMRSIFAKLKVNTRTRLAARLHEPGPDIPTHRNASV